ncbi:MAG: YcgN family cysteine cluster protein [Beijerinckiaceae bacterium]
MAGTETQFSPPPAEAAEPERFWEKPLEALTRSEWEQLCDGCGRCCLVKLEDEDTGKIHYTDVGCRLLEAGTCRCTDYRRRRASVPECVKLTPQNLRTIPWLPPTCAYRLRAEGHDLPWWHPLVSGDPELVHRVGVSVRGRIGTFEQDIREDDLPDHIASWPTRVPKRARG